MQARIGQGSRPVRRYKWTSLPNLTANMMMSSTSTVMMMSRGFTGLAPDVPFGQQSQHLSASETHTFRVHIAAELTPGANAREDAIFSIKYTTGTMPTQFSYEHQSEYRVRQKLCPLWHSGGGFDFWMRGQNDPVAQPGFHFGGSELWERAPPNPERAPKKPERHLQSKSESLQSQSGPSKARAGPTKTRAGPAKPERAPPKPERAPPRQERAPPRQEQAPPRPERAPQKAERVPQKTRAGPSRYFGGVS